MTRIILLFAFIFSFSSIFAQEVIIWEEQFDGGIPNTWEIGPGNPSGAIWQWSASGKADSAMLSTLTPALVWGDKGPIQSPSVDNGAAMYNSDVYDTGGIGFGVGPFPGQHSGSLTSPMIDLTEHPGVALKFNQYASANGAAVSTLLDLSTDGGNTWSSISINEEVILNHTTEPDDVRLVDLSELAGEQDSVQVRFTWDGRFYFWLLDDVQFIETPGNNLALGSEIFYPPTSYAQPSHQIANDIMSFYADISNLGSQDQTNVVLKAWVEDETGSILFADSTIIDVLNAGITDSTIHLDETYIAGTLAPETTYSINYRVYSLDDPEGDFSPSNNFHSASFLVTDAQFSKDDGIGIEGVGEDADWMYANVYEMGESEVLEGSFKAGTVSFSSARSSLEGPLDGEKVRILLFKVSPDVLPDWSNFDLTSIGQDDHLELIAIDTFEFPVGHQNFTLVETELQSIDGGEAPIIMPEYRYLLAASYEGSANNILHGSDQDINYYQVSSMVYVDQWSLEGFGPGEAAQLRLNIDIITADDEIPLPNNVLKLYPNPVRDQLNIDLSLKRPVEASVILADTSGRVMTYRTYQGAKKEQLQFDTSRFPAGQYFVRLVTKNGTKTKLFTVVK
jgi:hypothetical protein